MMDRNPIQVQRATTTTSFSSSSSPALPVTKAPDTTTLCPSCIAAREAPSWPDRLTSASKSYLHCARCKANHPRCLFSRSQRDANISHSIRYCIGHEGVLRLCEHKAVSWMQIVALSRSILSGKKNASGIWILPHGKQRYRVIKCKHSDHEVTDPGTSSCFTRIGSGRRRRRGYPTLTVGFKDSSKEFSLILSWEGHVFLDVPVGDRLEQSYHADVERQLKGKLAALREAQGRYICPEPEPGVRLEEMVVLKAFAGGNRSDYREQNHDVDDSNDRNQEKKGVRVTINPLKRSSLSPSLPPSPPTMRTTIYHGNNVPNGDDVDEIEPLLTRPNKKSPMFKHGQISGSARVSWGWGGIARETDTTAKVDDVDEVNNNTVMPPRPGEHHQPGKDEQDKKNPRQTHHHKLQHEKGKPPTTRNVITDTLKIRPCKIHPIQQQLQAPRSKLNKILERVKQWYHRLQRPHADDKHDEEDDDDEDNETRTGTTVCLKVKYKRRLCVGDHLRGPHVRDHLGFQNWISVLDPDSYRVTEDFEGEGVYWCHGWDQVLMGVEIPSGSAMDGRYIGNDNNNNNYNSNTAQALNKESGWDLDLDLDLDLDDTKKIQCANYYRYFGSRTRGLRLRAGDITHPCPRRR